MSRGGRSRHTLVAGLLAGLALLAGCRPASGAASDPSTATTPIHSGPVAASAPAALPSGSSTHTITVQGLVRSYRVYRPASSGSRLPLVVFLHGGFGSAAQAERYYGWDALADRVHALIAYPDGESRAWNVGGGCCGVPARSGTDDVAFITAMVRAIEAQVPVATDRVYATGISNGGMLAYRLACDTTIFAAIGPDSATQLGPCARPAPISILHIHGTADRTIPYDGSQGTGFARIHGPAVATLIAGWRAVDGCPAPTVATVGVVTRSVALCPSGRAVELITIAGAGHQWPGGRRYPGVGLVPGLDPPSTALDATTTIWQFFAAHPRAAGA
jgi:polyhydroxybutyrate depolymerase